MTLSVWYIVSNLGSLLAVALDQLIISHISFQDWGSSRILEITMRETDRLGLMWKVVMRWLVVREQGRSAASGKYLSHLKWRVSRIIRLLAAFLRRFLERYVTEERIIVINYRNASTLKHHLLGLISAWGRWSSSLWMIRIYPNLILI